MLNCHWKFLLLKDYKICSRSARIESFGLLQDKSLDSNHSIEQDSLSLSHIIHLVILTVGELTPQQPSTQASIIMHLH